MFICKVNFDIFKSIAKKTLMEIWKSFKQSYWSRAALIFLALAYLTLSVPMSDISDIA